MTRAHALIGTVMLLLCAARIPAQETTRLEPGSTLLRPDRISAVTDTYTITNYRDGAPWRTSKLVRAVARVNENGRALLRLAQLYETPQGITVDTTWLDAQTLAPARYFAEVYGEVQRFTFSPLEARGTVTPKDSAARDVVHTAPAPFFNAVALDLLYQALEAGDATNVSFDAYNPPRAALPLGLKFVARESVSLKGGGAIEAIKLAFGATGTHVWLDARTGALLLNGGGRGGGVAFWKVRSDVDASALVAASLK